MSDLAARQTLARVDVYVDEESASIPHAEKTTIILENITAVRRTKSKTHPYAFEIVDNQVRLSLSGYGEADTQSWMILLRHILWPRRSSVQPPTDAVEISIIDNHDSHNLQLSGNYWLRVTPAALSLLDPVDCHVMHSWGLNILKSFHLARTPDDRDKDQILVIQSGPMADSGEGDYLLFSPRAPEILGQIKSCIQQALAIRQHSATRQRTCSTTGSVLNYKILLDQHQSHVTTDVYPEEIATWSEEPERPLRSTVPKHLMASRSTSLPKSIAGLKLDGQPFSPPKHVIETHPRRLTAGDLSTCDPVNNPVRPTRSMENFSKCHSLPATNLIVDMIKEGQKDTDVVIRDKDRTVSVSSTVSRASGSITSRDSGIMFGTDNKSQIDEELNTDDVLRNTSNSFDSAVSTSCPAEESKPRATTLGCDPKDSSRNQHYGGNLNENYRTADETAEEKFNNEETVTSPKKKISVVSNIYMDIPSRKTSAASNDYAAIPADSLAETSVPVGRKLQRSYSADRLMRENDYEELDNFRKDLQKHLGFKAGVNSTDEPPALPDRPRSTQLVRRHQKQTSRKARASKVASMFIKSNKLVSSSSEEDDLNKLISQVCNWPLNTQGPVADDNNLYKSNADQVVYDEINKSYERLDDIVPADVAVPDRLASPPLFDMISMPPLSSQICGGTVDLLTASPTRLSPLLPLSPLLTPTKDIVDSSWTTASTSPGRSSLLVDIPDPSSRRRSSTLSCPCQDVRCIQTVEEEEFERTCSRSFSEISDHLSTHWSPISKTDPRTNDTYECMSGTRPSKPAISYKFLSTWEDFSTLGVSQRDTAQQNTWADFSVFGNNGFASAPETNGMETQTPSRCFVLETGEVNLINWDVVETPLADTDNTYMDMTLRKS
ncbi:uncharacterized protein LOC135475369 isoform X2 [Liolophura sinensis]